MSQSSVAARMAARYTYAAWAAEAGDNNAGDDDTGDGFLYHRDEEHADFPGRWHRTAAAAAAGDNNAGENAAGEEDVGDNNAGENAAGDNNAGDNPLATTPLATITRQYRELRRELCNQSARIQLLEDITRGGGATNSCNLQKR